MANGAGPGSAEYHYRQGVSLCAAGDSGAGGEHLRRALELAPQSAAVHEALGQWYFEAADLGKALLHSETALRLAPNAPGVVASRAVVLEGAGRVEEAWRAIEPLVRGGSPDPRVGLVYARVAPVVSREAEALAYLQARLSASDLNELQKAPLRFAAANLLDRAGRFDEAFEQARLAKLATRRPFDAVLHSRLIDHQIAYFTREKLRALPRAAHTSRRPVFVLGMPRSGTSLVEQVLASHPQVFGAGELPTLSRVATTAEAAPWARGEAYPDYLDLISAPIASEMAEQYLTHVRALNAAAPFVTDKMPMNFLFLGLVQVLLPECRVVHCVRDPRDTCLSCFMTYFANGHEFSHDLTHLGHYYQDYERLMAHWRAVLDLPVLDLSYEDLVADLEGQSRRMLEFVGLPWDERCLQFHQTKRAVPTASSAQVRRPLYSSSVGRWKHYERHLGPLIQALG